LVNNPLVHDQSHAINILGDYLHRDWPGTTKLSQRELKQYRQQNSIVGWRVPLVVDDTPTSIDLLIGNDYPYELPDVYLVGEKKALFWPHVESDNKLCVYPSNATFNPADPAGVASDLLSSSKALITELVRGNCKTDFADEFQNYWVQTVDFNQPKALLLNDLLPPSRHIMCWRGKSHTLFSDSTDDGIRWLKNHHQERFSEDDFKQALFLWFDSPLMPEQYPRSNIDIMKLAESCGAEKLLHALINEKSNTLYVVIGFLTQTGPTAAAIRVQRPPRQSIPKDRGVNPIVKGFRPGHVPQHILNMRMLSAGSKTRNLNTVRVDESWIHSRGGNGLPKKNKRICIVGCGSLGGQVSLLLAQTGYELELIDPDSLDWDNVGRHILGSPRSIQQNKAKALATHLSQQLPHRDIQHHATTWKTVWEKTPEVIMNCDIIVSTTGDWPSESALNRLNRTVAGFPDLIIGWTEAHALAGHALIIRDIGGCLCCGMSGVGAFSHEAIVWKEEQMAPIPACGGFYQPYGAIDLSQIHGLIARSVMDLAEGRIKKSEHRIWFGDIGRINTLGGTLAPRWNSPEFDIRQGLREYQHHWALNSQCSLCAPSHQ